MQTYQWGSERIRFMVDACEFGTYHQQLTKLLAPHLEGAERVCDVGCGLGYLSLELAKFVPHVTAVEVDEEAISVLRENCIAQEIGNIYALCQDAFSLDEAQQFDRMIFCVFGTVEEVLSIAEKHCTGEVLMITRNEKHHRFSHEQEALRDRKYSFENKCYELRKRGIPFEAKEFTLEFGQPFRNLEDAAAFYSLYSKKGNLSDEELLARLEKTDRQDFPFYLPKKSNLGFIRISMKG